MIVKTGANYQAEGGYIEASRNGDIITIDGAEYNDKYGVHSMSKLVIDNRTATGFSVWAGIDGSQTTPPTFNQRSVPANTQTEWQAFVNQTIVCSQKIVLSEESVGCEVVGAGGWLLHVTAVDAVAVITNVG